MSIINDVNFKAYARKDVVDFFDEMQSLQIPEQIIFEEIHGHLINQPILDIGVGGGRTTEYLANVSKDYVGIDYSKEMIDVCKRKYPDYNFLHCNAKNLSRFEDNKFGLVLFSFNGLDDVSPEDRLIILKDIYRVLKKDGYFVFSSHNKTYFNTHKFNLFKFSFNPARLLVRIIKYSRYKYFRIKNKKSEVHTDKYSIINDPGVIYPAMTYVTDIDKQKEQLAEIGFQAQIKAYDKDGNVVDTDSESIWIYYSARK